MIWENDTHIIVFEVCERTPLRTRHKYGDITVELSKLQPGRATAEEVNCLLESWVKCTGVYETDAKRLLRRSRKNRYVIERSATVLINVKNPIFDLEKCKQYKEIYDDKKEAEK